ncbi:MAG TPA: hypothetical protein PKE12_11200 [Kiritimatiellia bacterium]|nr:hypothetical protein [Kiritimatiellia bacterium]
MNWVTLDEAAVLAAMPSDLAAHYAVWLTEYPDKAGRLAELTANTVTEFRDAIRSNPANSLNPDPATIPQSAVRHAQSIIYFQLAMEMGLDIDTEGTQSMTRADMFLRQIAYKHFTATSGEVPGPSPSYTVPAPGGVPRALLAALVLVGLFLVEPAQAGWIGKNAQIKPFVYWVSTNSYLTSLGDPTSLYFVVVSPPSTNRIFP